MVKLLFQLDDGFVLDPQFPSECFDFGSKDRRHRFVVIVSRSRV
jgi:hypothetical protein